MEAGWLQSFISWGNFSHRFLADSWKTQQQEYYENKQLCRSGDKWAREVLQWVLKNARQQWDHQNDKLHKKQPNQIKDLAINANIWEQYNIGTNRMPCTAKVLFGDNIKHTLPLPIIKKQWLASVKAV